MKKLLILVLSIFLAAETAFAYPVVTQQGSTVFIANDQSTGTVANELVVLNTNSPAQAVLAPAGSTIGIIGVVGQGAGTSGSAQVITSGFANCVFDNAPTAGDYVIPSSTTAGNCHDNGSGSSTFSIGQASSTNASAGTYTLLLYAAATAGAVGPINSLPSQTGNYNAQGFNISNLGAPAASGDALSEGHAIGAVTAAAGTFTTTNGVANVVAQGVVCDGSTDNNTSSSGVLQTIINNAAAVAGHGTGEVDIPASCNYSSGHQLVYSTGLTIPSNMTIKGLGGSCKQSTTTDCVELDYSGSGVGMTLTNTHGDRLLNFRLKNTGTGTDGIDWVSSSGGEINGLDIESFGAYNLHLLGGVASTEYNTFRNSSFIKAGTANLFLDGTAAPTKSIGGNTFADNQIVASNGTSNVILSSSSSNPMASGYDNVYQNTFLNTDVSNGNGSATVGFTSNASLNTTLLNVIAESLNTIYVLNAGTVNWQSIGAEAAVNTNSTTGPLQADGASSYNICWDFLGGIGYPVCASQNISRFAYEEPVVSQEQTGSISLGLHQNLLLDSEAFQAGAWTTSGITSVTDASQTNPAGIPNSASAVVVTPAGSSFVQQIYNHVTAVTNLCYTGSVWARTASGTAKIQSLVTDAAGFTNGGLNTAIISTSWQRLVVVGCAGSSDVSTAITYRPLYYASAAPTVTVYLWGAQLSQMNSAEAYQATVATKYTGTDPALTLNNGAHLISAGGTLPTIGTGSITAGGTDNALEATGATSPATVTFATAFLNKPICTCSDETSALGACKVVPTATTAVVTTTGTDSFDLICVGK